MFGSDVLASNFPCVYTAKSEAVFNIRTQKWNKHLLTLEQLLAQ